MYRWKNTQKTGALLKKEKKILKNGFEKRVKRLSFKIDNDNDFTPPFASNKKRKRW